MIWSVVLDLKQIQQQGKGYAWPRPESCPRCRHWQVWGHGFALRYVDGFSAALPMKCYRCPQCGCVMTARPADYFPRIRSTMAVIVTCLTRQLTRDRWPAEMRPRSRLRHWLRIPEETGHRFRCKVGHPFRSKLSQVFRSNLGHWFRFKLGHFFHLIGIGGPV